MAPPTKVCPRCATQAETFAGDCPNCGRSYTATSPWKIAVISVAALLLTVGGCAACVAVVAEDADVQNGISREEYDGLSPGATQSAVERDLGEPYGESEEANGRTCIYYYEDEFLSDREFGVCFRDGRLVRKFAYEADN